MRFMLLLKGDPQPAEGTVLAAPPEELIGAMLRYSEELTKAGVLLAAEGLDPSASGSRIVYKSGRKTVVDGPFAEAKELVAGFYLIQVKSREEAIEWAKRCPVEMAVTGTEAEAVVEVRRVADADEIPTITDELIAKEQELRARREG
jgi:hypothetical protein